MNAKEMLASIFGVDQVDSADLPPGDLLRQKADRISEVFTTSVDFLWHHFPSTAINRRAEVLWHMVGSKEVAFAIGPPVPTLSLIGTSLGKQGESDPEFAKTRTVERAAILAPTEWLKQYRESPYMQLGAIVYIASKVTDVYNQKPLGLFEARARVYEAEYLFALLRTEAIEAHELNDYQRHVLEKHPQGVDTPNAHALVYDSKPI